MEIHPFICFLLLSVICSYVDALSVLSVDIGNEYIKIAIVSPGKPMEIVYNEESQRKTPLIVAFRDGERLFGDAAVTTSVRFPDKAFSYLLDVIGKRVDSPGVNLYKQRFPYHNITAHPSHSTVVFHHPDGQSFTPEELLAMILNKAKKFAETTAGGTQKITDAVLTVPAYFTQAERRAVLLSAKLAGLKVLQLINTNAAVALNYGIFRRKDFNESSPTNILFYDMGATQTVATVASYQLVKTKDRGFVETNPQVVIKGVGFDRTLGGFEMQHRLRDHIAKVFAEQTKKDLEHVKSNKRAMAKLLKESAKIKTVLSANTEYLARVENVMEDLDFKSIIKRDEFEEMCADLFKDRVTEPISVALKSAELSLDDIQYIIPFGGNTRVPRVQQILKEFFNGRDLSHSINTDESAALGAAYQAAYLSAGFKVKPFILKDVTLYPVQVQFSRQNSDTAKLVQRILFNRNNPYPQKKVLTFSKHHTDFDFYVSYGDISGVVRTEDLGYITPQNISYVRVNGVVEAVSKHEDKEGKGIKAHFRLDENGILSLDNVDAVFEHKVEEQVPVAESGNVVGDAIAKFGNTISKLFGKSDENPDGGANTTETNGTAANETVANATASPDASNSTANETKVNGTKIKTEIKVKTVKEPLLVDVVPLDLPHLSEEEYLASKNKLKELDAKDQAKLQRDQARNKLESFISETRMKLYEPEYEQASTDAEKEELQNALNEASEWLENEADKEETKAMESKLSELMKLAQPIFERAKEHRERPEAIKALTDMLNISKIFLESTKNISQSEAKIFTDIEITTLENLINGSQSWLNDVLEEQAKAKLNESPKVLVKEIAERISLLDREIKYLLNKARMAPPPPPPASEEKPAEENKAETSEPVDEPKDTPKKDEDSPVPDPPQIDEGQHTEL